jgi:hypothetical protein
MKYIVVGLIVVIAVVAWWLNRRDAAGSRGGDFDATSAHQRELPPRDRGIGGGGFYSGGGGS